jgi:putative ABC transport system permease protein
VIAWTQVLGALALVGVAIALSFWRRARLENDIAVAVARSFVQLVAVGYVLKLIFDAGHVAWTLPLLATMVLFGAFTARGRARSVPNALPILVVALGTAAAGTLGIALLTGALHANARSLIPVGGMTIGNAMASAAVALNRLGDEFARSTGEIEARLSLGATATEAAAPAVRRSLVSGMINVIDSTKTAGLVFFPGTMVGMILAGAAPLNAVRLQLILFYLLVGSVTISVVIAVSLASSRFFTGSHQLRDRA